MRFRHYRKFATLLISLSLIRLYSVFLAHLSMPESSLMYPYQWQQSQWQRLSQQRQDGKLPHALMLAGQDGIGKFNFALALSHWLLCLEPNAASPCGRCKGCDLSLAETHPDLCVVQPEDKSKVIKIEQIRRLTDFIAKTSQQGGMKIAVLEPVEALNVNAANALLKSLEEPSGDTLLLLVSHTPSQVMATIRSRCQQVEFSLPAQAEAKAWLEPLAAGQDVDYLLQCAGGAPLAALGLLEGDQLEARALLSDGLLKIAEGQLSPLDLAAQFAKREPLETLSSLMQWLQRGIRAQALQQDALEAVEGIIVAVPNTILYRFWDKLVLLKRQLLSSANPNKQLLLEELLMDWQALCRQRQSQSRQHLLNELG